MKTKNGRVSKVEWILGIIYVGLIGLAVYLNPSGTKDMENFIVNSIFFVLVAAIFLCVFLSFSRTNKMVQSLKDTASHIKELFELNGSNYLWDTYKSKDEVFNHPLLDGLFKEYRDESNRLNKDSNSSFKCDIEDYINRGVIDDSIRKNILSLVPGTMTGLGILGTFVGLSFGLNSFSTGTTTEITESITPLMGGIKVAFHTSIYGMVLSLVFNFVYKYKLAEAYDGLDRLLDAFAKYVVPDAQNENMNLMLSYQKQQADDSHNLVVGLGEVFAQKMAEVMKPQLEKMDSFLEEQKHGNELLVQSMDRIIPKLDEFKSALQLFSEGVTDKQIEGINLLVDKFISEMNATVDGSFDRLKDTINETCKLQKANGESISKALEKVSGMLSEVTDIDLASKSIITGLSDYVQKIEALQSIINDNFMSVNMQLDDNLKMTEKQQQYVEKLVAYEENVSELSKNVEVFLEEHRNSFKKLNDEMEQRNVEGIQKMSEATQACCGALTQMVQLEYKEVSDTAVKQITTVANHSVEANEALLNSTKIQLAQLVKTVQGASNDMNSARKDLNNTATEVMSKTEKAVNQSLEQAGTRIREVTTQVNRLAKVLETYNEKRNQ